MGVYVNSPAACTLYRNEVSRPYFVDKTQMLQELFPLVTEGGNYICITRPRRFGKTVMANMISSFFSKGQDMGDIFGRLVISGADGFRNFLNRYFVIHICLNELPRRCGSYEQYISRIEKKLLRDLKQEFPDVPVCEDDAVWDVLTEIYTGIPDARFIFVLDEWDFIFHRDFVTDEDKKLYLAFLSSLLKDKPYVLLAYMTGILPIAKYSSGSELNMFLEYTMASEERFSTCFGFTEAETDGIYGKYLERSQHPAVTRDGLREWYNGYQTCVGERVYNPRSVTGALVNNQLGNYWTSSGPYDEIFYYVQNNIADVREDLVRMVSGEAVHAQVREYAAVSMNLKTKNEIFSAMVVYGFLSCRNGRVFIPNQELMGQFADMLQKESSLGYVYRLAKESSRMLQATLAGDTETMEKILEYVHHTEIPLLHYNSETELAGMVNLIYLAARDSYRVEREDKAGTGYVDFIFYPATDRSADCLILELKVNATPKEAIRQIKDRRYALRFAGKLGEERRYAGRVLAVGISYDRASQKHKCEVEVLLPAGKCQNYITVNAEKA